MRVCVFLFIIFVYITAKPLMAHDSEISNITISYDCDGNAKAFYFENVSFLEAKETIEEKDKVFLKKLTFVSCSFQDEDILYLCDLIAKHKNCFRSITFKHIQSLPSSFKQLMSVFSECSLLKTVIFKENNLSEELAIQLIQAMAGKPVQKLILKENLLNASAQILNKFLVNHQTIQEISISWRDICSETFCSFIQSLLGQSHLKNINLSLKDSFHSLDISIFLDELLKIFQLPELQTFTKIKLSIPASSVTSSKECNLSVFLEILKEKKIKKLELNGFEINEKVQKFFQDELFVQNIEKFKMNGQKI